MVGWHGGVTCADNDVKLGMHEGRNDMALV